LPPRRDLVPEREPKEHGGRRREAERGGGGRGAGTELLSVGEVTQRDAAFAADGEQQAQVVVVAAR
jgi:hypothetical protein